MFTSKPKLNPQAATAQELIEVLQAVNPGDKITVQAGPTTFMIFESGEHWHFEKPQTDY